MEGSGEFFAPLLQFLGASINTQVIPFPQDNVLTYEQLTDFVKKQVPLHTPYVLLGESFSGPIAVSIAAPKPPNLIGLILVGTFIRSPLPLPPSLWNTVCRLPPSWLPFRFVAWFLLNGYGTRELLSQLYTVLSGIPDRVMQERLRSILEVDVSKEATAINVPMLYIRASQDKIVPRSASELILSFQPAMQIAEMNGPHFILQIQPKTATGIILRFIQGLIDGENRLRIIPIN